MSATNRGSIRKDYDFYATPPYVIYNLLDNLDLNRYGKYVLEPSAGNGNISRIIKEKYPDKIVTSIETREEEYYNLCFSSDQVVFYNYLNLDFIGRYDIIIGNPPYSLALEFVNKSIQLLNDNGILIFLLRTAFLESKSRYDFWQQNPLSGLYTLSKRPSFTGRGTDATSYSWFIWDKSTNKQVIKII